MPVVKYAIVARANVADGLHALLLGSGGRNFVEASPTANKWGIGMGMKDVQTQAVREGENLLGQCYDAARDLLVAERKS